MIFSRSQILSSCLILVNSRLMTGRVMKWIEIYWNGMKHFDNSEVPQDPQTLTFCILWASRLRTANERRCTAESSQLPSGPIHSSSPQFSNRSIWFWIRRLAQNNCAKIIYLVYLYLLISSGRGKNVTASVWISMVCDGREDLQENAICEELQESLHTSSAVLWVTEENQGPSLSLHRIRNC